MKKYLVIARTVHMARNVCHVYNLKEFECIFISKRNYMEINSLKDGLIVFREFIDYNQYITNKGNIKLDKKLKYRIFSFFELMRKKELKAILRKENRRQLKYKFTKKEDLKVDDRVLFRYKELPNIYGVVNVQNDELFINDTSLEEFNEIFYGNIRVIKNEKYEDYYRLEDREALHIYTHMINHQGKSINEAMQLLMN